MDLLDGVVEAIPLRGLTRDTADKFGYKVGTFKGFKAHIATYHDATGRPVAQKVRWKEDGKKQFTWIGDPKAATLYGQNVWRDAGKMVVVTEGELDALAVSQVQNNRWPVVSIPNGAGGAAKDLAKQVAWLERFEKIVLCFDMDEPGRQAVEACTKLFTPGKVFDCRLPLKDACDMVKAHRSAELVDALWGAKSTRPDGIKSVADLREKAMEPTAWGLPWPWRTLTERTYGIQRRYVYSWGAGVGSGKTTLQKQLMLTAMRPELLESHDGLVDHLGQPIVIPEPRKVGTILFEENPAKTLRSLAGMALGLRLNKPDVQYDKADLAAAIDSFDGLFFPLDMFGARDWETVKSNVLYLILAEGVKDIFIDPLTALVANVDDERRALDDIMAELSGIAEAHEATLHLVSHLTTPQGTAHEEGGRVLEKHFTGSRAIARWSHAMIGLERDKQKPDNPTTVRGLKDREFGEAVGPLLGLTFDRVTGRMVECPIDDGNPFKDETQNHDL